MGKVADVSIQVVTGDGPNLIIHYRDYWINIAAISGNTATDPLALPDSHIEPPVLPPPPLRHSTRTRNRPDRYGK